MSLQHLKQVRHLKRKESQTLFDQIQLYKARMQTLTNELMDLDDKIERLEDGEDQPSSLTMNPDDILQEPPPSLTMNVPQEETLTDPFSATQEAAAASSNFFDYQAEEDEGPPAPARNNNNSVAASLPPLEFQQVASKPRKRQRQLQISTNTDVDDKSALSGLVSPNCPFSFQQIQNTLRQTFHIQNFRETQQDIIQATLSGQDCFVIMRTGGGKSLTYQLPAALERPKVTLVISPLLSLIQDQEAQMNQFLPNSCVSFTSGIGQAQHTQNWQRVRDPNGGVAMILVTPEKVHKSNKLKSELQKLHQQNRLARFVIDECHCACQWGHDFRPDYCKLGLLKTHFPDVPVLAVTATASERVRNDCANILRLDRHYRFFRSTANRPNLTYQVRPKDSSSDVLDDMTAFIKEKHANSAGIIYTYSRKDADTVANELCERGIVAEAYHSNVNGTKREFIHQSWMRNETQVVVATIAFGLGINKPDVQFVLHHTLSKTLEAYYQESGRAGRDGNPADCVLYYSPKDVPRMIKMIHGEQSEPLFMHMVQYGQRFGGDQICRATILKSLGEQSGEDFDKLLGLHDTTNTSDISSELKVVTTHAQTCLQLLYLRQADNVTMPMLIKDWRARPDGAPECVQSNPPGKELPVTDCEQVIIQLLVFGYITVNVKWSRYDSIVYLVCSPKAQSFLTSGRAILHIRVPKRVAKAKSTASSSKATKRKRPASTTTKKRRASTGTRKRSSKGRKKSASKVSSKPRATKKRSFHTSIQSSSNNIRSAFAAAPRLSTSSQAPEVIELDDDSSSDESDFIIGRTSMPARLKPPPALVAATSKKSSGEKADPLWDDSESEFEFEE